MVAKSCIDERFTYGHGNGGIQSEGFHHDAVQERQLVENTSEIKRFVASRICWKCLVYLSPKL